MISDIQSQDDVLLECTSTFSPSSLGGAVKMKESAIKLMENDAKMLYFSMLPSGHSVFLAQRPRRKSFPQHMTLKRSIRDIMLRSLTLGNLFPPADSYMEKKTL